MRRGSGMRGGHRGSSRIGGHSRGFRTNRRHHGRYNRGYRYGSGYYYGRGRSRGSMVVFIFIILLIFGGSESLFGIFVFLAIVGVIYLIVTKNKKASRLRNQGGTQRSLNPNQNYQTGPKPNSQVVYNQRPPVKYCSACGSALLPNSTFCTECGTKVI